MILPKLDEGLKHQMKLALKKVSDQDVIDYLEQKATFDSHSWEQNCISKLYALLYDYEEKLNRYEEDLNDLAEKFENKAN